MVLTTPLYHWERSLGPILQYVGPRGFNCHYQRVSRNESADCKLLQGDDSSHEALVSHGLKLAQK